MEVTNDFFLPSWKPSLSLSLAKESWEWNSKYPENCERQQIQEQPVFQPVYPEISNLTKISSMCPSLMLLSTHGQIFLLKKQPVSYLQIFQCQVKSGVFKYQLIWEIVFFGEVKLRFKYKTKSETGKEFYKIEVKQFSRWSHGWSKYPLLIIIENNPILSEKMIWYHKLDFHPIPWTWEGVRSIYQIHKYLIRPSWFVKCWIYSMISFWCFLYSKGNWWSSAHMNITLMLSLSLYE